MIIKICVGSSCHLKGSYGVIEALQDILRRYGVEDRVSLQASFCLGYCADGVTVRCSPSEESADEEVVWLHRASKDNIEQLFQTEVLPKLNIEQ